MERYEDEILQRLETLKLWQEQQESGVITEEQKKLMRQLGLSFEDTTNFQVRPTFTPLCHYSFAHRRMKI